ncbi:threonine synthase [soil metagenome]
MTEHTTMTHLECARCQRSYDADAVAHLCECGSPLLVRYDLERAGARLDPGVLAGRSNSDFWRLHEVLPLRDPANAVSLGESVTPLLEVSTLGAEVGIPHLMLKDEGLNPTGTFKARGAVTGVSRAKELGVKVIAMPTNGNAGGAWASYGARAGIEVVLCMPTDAPPLSVVEADAAGATASMVRGQISDAGAMIAAQTPEHGWYEAATLKEPYRIEGKKVMGYEIAEQLGWRLPDAIVYPTGGGVGLIGIYKAFLEMQQLGWIDDPLPKLICVQAEGCAPIVRAFEAGADTSQPWPDAQTVAQGIRVPKALGDFLVLAAVRATGGTAVAVSDEPIRDAMRTIARSEGLFICPEGAANVVALPALLERGALDPDDRVVLLNTGCGLKYPETLSADLPVLDIGDRLPPARSEGASR